jgi:uncharacterized membrane protein YuzA (DUF378 family)
MNKKRTQMNLGVKILLLVFGIITLFSAVNCILIGIENVSLVRIVTHSVALTMQIFYAVMGVSSLVTSVVLAIKIFKR